MPANRNTRCPGTAEVKFQIVHAEAFSRDVDRVCGTKRHAVGASTGLIGNALVGDTCYDAAGNPIKEQAAGSQAFTKTVYDGVGRPVRQYVGYDTDEAGYADASNVADDTLKVHKETTYDPAGNATFVLQRDRYHNATGTGELTTPSGDQPKARVTYLAQYYDPIGRPTATVNYGTYGANALTRPPTVADRSDDVLVSSVEYNDAGEAYKSIDPAGREDRREFDDAGRVTKTIQNYQDGVVDEDYPDEDVTVETTYNADGKIATLTAKNPTTGDQVTRYVYGTTLADSAVGRADLLRAEIYPDSDDTADPLGNGNDGLYDRVEFRYNRQGEPIEKKDQNETVHQFEYDGLGRLLADKVTTVGAGVDAVVRRIARSYEVRGMLEKLTSYDAATGGSALNEVLFEYDSAGLLSKEYQEHAGTKDAETLYVQYNYDQTASGGICTKGLRPTSLRYPNARLVHTTYGTTGSNADALSRIAAINADNSGTPGDALSEYTYLGLRTVVQVDYPEPDLRFDLAHGSGADPYDGPMDRFGRVTDLLWRDYGSSTDAVRIQHGYDRAANRLWREDPVAAANGKDFDELYTYDGMYQLVNMQRGDLNANHDAIQSGTKTFAEDWSLDMSGNWSTYKQDDDGDGDWDLDQSRGHNKANEIAQIGGSSSHIAHDRTGNMTRIPKPGDWNAHFDLTYDAWNRLVKVEDDENTVAEYAYDGRNFRVVKKTYDSGELAETRHFYYNSRWQCLEERLESGGELSANPERHFLWGLRYIDDLLLRDRDTDANGSLDERIYSLEDPNWNTAAIAAIDGDVQERCVYEAYGVPLFMSGSFTPRAGSEYLWTTLYAGYSWDAQTEFYYVRHRHFPPEIGCWSGRDPFPNTLGHNGAYAYVHGNPTCYLDPFGLQKCSVDYFHVSHDNDCAFRYFNGELVYGYRFTVHAVFKKPNCECCEYRQYITCTIRSSLFDPGTGQFSDWIYEEVYGEPYEDCQLYADGTSRCYGHREDPGEPGDNYSADGCVYTAKDMPGKRGVQSYFNANPSAVIHFEMSCRLVLNIVDVCCGRDQDVVATQVLDFDCSEFLTKVLVDGHARQ